MCKDPAVGILVGDGAKVRRTMMLEQRKGGGKSCMTGVRYQAQIKQVHTGHRKDLSFDFAKGIDWGT